MDMIIPDALTIEELPVRLRIIRAEALGHTVWTWQMLQAKVPKVKMPMGISPEVTFPWVAWAKENFGNDHIARVGLYFFFTTEDQAVQFKLVWGDEIAKYAV